MKISMMLLLMVLSLPFSAHAVLSRSFLMELCMHNKASLSIFERSIMAQSSRIFCTQKKLEGGCAKYTSLSDKIVHLDKRLTTIENMIEQRANEAEQQLTKKMSTLDEKSSEDDSIVTRVIWYTGIGCYALVLMTISTDMLGHLC